MRVEFFIAATIFCGAESFAQQDSISYKAEIALTVDNDIFFFTDRYYTAGHEVTYRKLLHVDQPLYRWLNITGGLSKVIVSYKFGNKIFTPKKVRFVNPINMDRPYAGYSYGGISVARLKGNSTISNFGFEFGLVGEKTGLGRLQTWWHEKTGFQEPRGWDSQITNEWVYNFNYQITKGIKLFDDLDLVSNSGIFVGTGSNRISQDFTLRMIDFNPLTQSLFSNSLLGFQGNPTKEEVFIFLGWGVDYVISNIFLEGSLHKNNPSPFTVKANEWVLRRNVGIMYSRDRGSFSLTFNNVSKEVLKGLKHNYMSFATSLRF